MPLSIDTLRSDLYSQSFTLNHTRKPISLNSLELKLKKSESNFETLNSLSMQFELLVQLFRAAKLDSPFFEKLKLQIISDKITLIEQDLELFIKAKPEENSAAIIKLIQNIPILRSKINDEYIHDEDMAAILNRLEQNIIKCDNLREQSVQLSNDADKLDVDQYKFLLKQIVQLKDERIQVETQFSKDAIELNIVKPKYLLGQLVQLDNKRIQIEEQLRKDTASNETDMIKAKYELNMIEKSLDLIKKDLDKDDQILDELTKILNKIADLNKKYELDKLNDKLMGIQNKHQQEIDELTHKEQEIEVKYKIELEKINQEYMPEIKALLNELQKIEDKEGEGYITTEDELDLKIAFRRVDLTHLNDKNSLNKQSIEIAREKIYRNYTLNVVEERYEINMYNYKCTMEQLKKIEDRLNEIKTSTN